MKKFLNTAIAGIVLATSGVATIAPASGQDSRARERFVESYCARYPGDRDCVEWRRDNRRWDNARYQRWYRDRYSNNNDAAAAAIFGLAAGAIAGAAISSATQPRGTVVVDTGHTQRCVARYKSYDVASDTFLGYDGQRHRCNL